MTDMSGRERSTLAWGSTLYTQDQMTVLVEAYRGLLSNDPQAAYQLEVQMAESVPFDELDLPENKDILEKRKMIRPETGISVQLVDIPPHVGKGSGHAVWAEFASMVSDMDEEVIEQFSRDEIIDILVDRDIINDPRPKKGEG